jgi:transcriptional regulator with XRE-family HTH domain
MNDLLAAIGTRVRTLRLDAGLTQQQLADTVHLSRSSIANLEAGRQGDIGITLLIALAEVLGTTADALTGTTAEQTRTEQRIARLEDQVRRLAHVLNAASGALGAFDLVIKETD